ncbi:hypothetical protein OHB26_00610 [Nocardia sp. NBC_01503]|uniref:hypothetical protein n=1 Tax=Nocardia sp. NBC_01503 TaxID=2975997 RepID=UPI002E7B4A6C|nr:hypothetical protein [Nocardia sp. NBC_01503]WTL32801.1 hypothetical protein OHB26_00610 [Nocardia sp. NBC_01503]
MNVGETAAAELYQSACGGTFQLDPAVARECAAHFLRFADSLDPHLGQSHRIQTLTGFGALDSSRQLSRGFESKAVALTATLTTLQSNALAMAAAYLLSAGLIQQTDETRSRALLSARAGL